MTGADQDYVSYLLRLWRAREGQRDVWRASLQDPQSGERISFATLEALFAFVQERLEERSETRDGGKMGTRAEPGPTVDG